VWDSSACALVADYVMQVEEAGLETEFIPEKSRVCLCGIAVDSQDREIFWLPYSSIGESVYKEALISW
jgi:hypothetical protein